MSPPKRCALSCRTSQPGNTHLVTPTPIVKDLVLIGCGHAHVAVLRRFGMRPVPGARITLISREVHTPYSGMLPGLIAGHYGYDDVHIDAGPLARFAQARLYHDEAVGLDFATGRVLCRNRPPVPFDLVSIDLGSAPRLDDVPGTRDGVIAVKPIDRLVARWREVEARVLAEPRTTIGIVGAGAAGCELALATQWRLKHLLAERKLPVDGLGCFLIGADDTVLPSFPPPVRDRYLKKLVERGVTVMTGRKVLAVEGRRLLFAREDGIELDVILWVTEAGTAPWLKDTGLALDDGGFIKLNDRLQSVSHAQVFAAGDCATMVDHPRPKAGVFAVRQGPPLADNLRRALAGKALKRFVPQSKYLALISTGDKYAVASRGTWSAEGRLVWHWKDWIDRRFMRRYNRLPAMREDAAPLPASGLADQAALRELSTFAMRCGGCGAKIGTDLLARVLGRLQPVRRAGVLIGLDAPDDAAAIEVPAGRVLVQSVDQFRAFIDDPFLFGRIAANHALGDLHAMGAAPHSALALATIPYGIEAKVEADLEALMTGALEVLKAEDCALIGGHTAEGAELALGFVVNGLAEPAQILRKSGLRPGDALILTKPVGTGALFAAAMRGKAKARWIDAALETMQVSNRGAAQILRAHGAGACTDVTGFGLIGHLVEMVRASDVDVTLDAGAVPLIEGAAEVVRAGIFSSLQPQNLRLRRAVREADKATKHAAWPLLFDPQTAGGLLAGVPPERVDACLAALRDAGYSRAAVIGRVAPRSDAAEPITLSAV
jgi:selenide, water dikinase